MVTDPISACVSCRKALEPVDEHTVVVKLRSGGERKLGPLCEDCYQQYPSTTHATPEA